MTTAEEVGLVAGSVVLLIVSVLDAEVEVTSIDVVLVLVMGSVVDSVLDSVVDVTSAELVVVVPS